MRSCFKTHTIQRVLASIIFLATIAPSVANAAYADVSEQLRLQTNAALGTPFALPIITQAPDEHVARPENSKRANPNAITTERLSNLQRISRQSEALLRLLHGTGSPKLAYLSNEADLTAPQFRELVPSNLPMPDQSLAFLSDRLSDYRTTLHATQSPENFTSACSYFVESLYIVAADVDPMENDEDIRIACTITAAKQQAIGDMPTDNTLAMISTFYAILGATLRYEAMPTSPSENRQTAKAAATTAFRNQFGIPIDQLPPRDYICSVQLTGGLDGCENFRLAINAYRQNILRVSATTGSDEN